MVPYPLWLPTGTTYLHQHLADGTRDWSGTGGKAGDVLRFPEDGRARPSICQRSLDMVFGVAILHHLEFACATREIHRVLRGGGKIVFVEPLRHNPVARVVRWLTPHARTPDELPLGRPELRLIARNFEVDNYYSELFTVIGAMIARPLFKNPINPVTRCCDFVDHRLAQMVPAAGVYYRSVVIRGTKKATAWQG